MDKFAYADRRVFIVDLNAMVHRYFNAMAKVSLSAVVLMDGKEVTINTSVVSSVLKAITRLSNEGSNAVVVVTDRPLKARKAFFEYYMGTGEIGSLKSGYKGTRDGMLYRIGDDLKIITNFLERAGANILYKEDYEADDIIPVVIKKAKETWVGCPIHIVANDLDLAPLIDEQVSMYRRTKKLAYAEEGYPVLTSMYQTTINNYQEEMEATTAFKGLTVPYNTVVLAKLLRGDKSDNIRQIEGLTPTKYRNIVTDIVNRGDIPDNLFTYHAWDMKFIDKLTGTSYEHFVDVPTSVVTSGNAHIDLKEPAQIEVMRLVLGDYLNDVEVHEAMLRYEGINLNGAFLRIPNSDIRRRPFYLPKDYKIVPFPKQELTRLVAVLNINLVNV